MKQEFLADKAGTFSQYIYDDNQIIISTSATITVYNPNTNTKLIDGQAMTVESDGELTYALTTTHNDIADENYHAEITYIVGGVTDCFTTFYDVVKVILHQVINHDDIVQEIPSSADLKWKTLGNITSGSTTIIVDVNLSKFQDDYFTGGTATNLNNQETRKIVDFVSITGTVVTDTFATTNGASERYSLARSFTREIDRAWDKLMVDIRNNGKRPFLILDPNDLRETHIIYTIIEVAKGFMNETDEFWVYLYEQYTKKAKESFTSISGNFKYDTSEDGFISSGEEHATLNKRTTGRG